MNVAFISTGVDQVVSHGVFYGTAHFVSMRAIGKPAVRDERTHISEITRNFLRRHIPKLHLPDARRVDNIASCLKANQPCSRRRMSAFVRFSTDRRNPQSEAGLHSIQQGRFSNAALTGKNGFAIGQRTAQPIDSLACSGAAQQ